MPGYPIPAAEPSVETWARNSRFLASVARVDTVAAARAGLARIRARYPDASHHVYAFAVGHGATVVHGLSDDGEPGGTAGRPVLAVVQGSGLGDVMVVVSRYFGGTRLGTGGLVRAYTEAAQAVLAVTPTAEKVTQLWFCLSVAYPQYQACRQALASLGATVVDEQYGAEVEISGWVREELGAQVNGAVQDASAGRARLGWVSPP